MSSVTATASSDAVLRESGGALAFGTLATGAYGANSVTVGKLAQLAGLSVLGVTGSSTANVAAITAGSDAHFLRRRSGALSFGTIILGDVTGAGNSRIPTGNASGVLEDSAELTYVTASGLFTVTKSVSGAAVTGKIENSNNASTSSHAVVHAAVGGTSGGNPGLLMDIPSGTSWRLFNQNDDSDIVKLQASTSYPAAGAATFAWDSSGRFSLGRTPLASRQGGNFPLLQIHATTPGDQLSMSVSQNSITGVGGFTAESNGGAVIKFLTQASSASGTNLRTNALTGVLTADQILQIFTTGTKDIVIGAGTTEALTVNAAGPNIGHFATSSTNYQSMVKGMFVANATSLPTGNPVGGGFFFADAGALKWRGSSGTVTTIAPA
jgi:hypothetical protein